MIFYHSTCFLFIYFQFLFIHVFFFIIIHSSLLILQYICSILFILHLSFPFYLNTISKTKKKKRKKTVVKRYNWSVGHLFIQFSRFFLVAALFFPLSFYQYDNSNFFTKNLLIFVIKMDYLLV